MISGNNHVITNSNIHKMNKQGIKYISIISISAYKLIYTWNYYVDLCYYG